MIILLSITIFLLLGTAFIFGSLAFGMLLRPKAPGTEKSAAYECGEPAVGSSWVQFDLRFYIVALLFLVFDVEVALFYPWAVVYGDAARISRKLGLTLFQLRSTAVVDMLIFFGVLMLGFAYLWRFGYLDWVKVTPRAIRPHSEGLLAGRPAPSGAPSPSTPPTPSPSILPPPLVPA